MVFIFFLLIESFFITNSYMEDKIETKEAVRQQLKNEAYFLKGIVEGSKTIDYNLMRNRNSIKFSLFDLEKKMIFSSELDKERDLKNDEKKELNLALSEGEGFSLRKSEKLSKKLAHYALILNGEYIVKISKDYEDMKLVYKFKLFLTTLFFIFLNILAIICYKYFLKKHIENRLLEIQKALETKERIENFEVADDSWLEDFWKILKKWQQKNLRNTTKIIREKERLQDVLLAVDTGILLINKNGEIKSKNRATNYLFYEGKINKLEHKIKYRELYEIIEKHLSKRATFVEEVEISDLNKEFLVTIKYLENLKEHIVTIKDITRTKELMKLQKDFITNIGHELKTPLTNINGYLIALEEAEEEALRKSFFKIVKSNVSKLENIILDFLNLSKIENSRILNKERYPIEEIFSQVERELKRRIEQNSVKLSYEVNLKEDNYLNIDREKLLLILKNLVENAIIYSKESPEVLIKVNETYDKYVFNIIDNGIGISKKELNLIFDRFYRVDKARTSNVAGTGLGLAIVKENIESYKGSIYVDSVEGKGTNFKFTILK